jgi:glycosyltransferase involved in cell wall biosynthesis
MLAPVAWRVPPATYGPWELCVSLLTEGLVRRGVEVTLFATADSITSARLDAVCPFPCAECRELDYKTWECLNIARAMERADEFDLIHNHDDFLPLSYSQLVRTPMVTTIHGFSSEKILPAYRAFNGKTHYVAISQADRRPDLAYAAVIHHGIDLADFPFQAAPEDYLAFYGRIHPDKGAAEAIAAAQKAGLPLKMAGLIQDEAYFRREIQPHVDGKRVSYLGTLPRAQGAALIGSALALLHLINFAEPFGLSVVEAMACGTPVIARPAGSMPEIIRHGATGYLVAGEEETQAAIEACRSLPRRPIRAEVEKRFTMERMVDEYLRVYAKIASR